MPGPLSGLTEMSEELILYWTSPILHDTISCKGCLSAWIGIANIKEKTYYLFIKRSDIAEYINE